MKPNSHLLLLCFSLCGCVFVSQDVQAIEDKRKVLLNSLKKFERANPTSDLRQAIKKRDFRFIGYRGITYIVPGIPDGQANIHAQKRGLNIIPGTSDVILQEEDSRRLQRIVARYMTPYNKALLAYLTKKKK